MHMHKAAPETRIINMRLWKLKSGQLPNNYTQRFTSAYGQESKYWRFPDKRTRKDVLHLHCYGEVILEIRWKKEISLLL
jgi:hypothetical protein